VISIIAAYNNNRVIGKNGSIPWKLPEDLKMFRETTIGHPVIMGSKTYHSIGKPLSSRSNIVLSRKPYHQWYTAGDAIVIANTLFEALKFARDYNGGKEEIFIIGGENVYRQALPFCHKMYLTHVDDNSDGDTFFPEVDGADWKITEGKMQESEAGLNYFFDTYERIK